MGQRKKIQIIRKFYSFLQCCPICKKDVPTTVIIKKHPRWEMDEIFKKIYENRGIEFESNQYEASIALFGGDLFSRHIYCSKKCRDVAYYRRKNNIKLEFKICPHCGEAYEGRLDKRTCGKAACRKAEYRSRK